MRILLVILPAILTIIGNIIFYLWFKAKVDNSIEKHKISYSGVFKEKIDIYKELLKKIYEIKTAIQQYQYFGKDEDDIRIMESINSFITFYQINQPFLSDKMLAELVKIRSEFQSVFDNFYMHNSTRTEIGIDGKTKIGLVKKFFEAGNKLKTNQPFKVIEETIILEIKSELKLDSFK